LVKAINDVKQKKMTYREASDKYGISIATISRRMNHKHNKNYGGQYISSSNEENVVVETILFVCSD